MRALGLIAIVLSSVSCAASGPALRFLDETHAAVPSPEPAATDDFRARPPGARGELQLVPPAVEELRLSNGIRVLLAPRRNLPVVAIRLVVDRGEDQVSPAFGAIFGGMLARGTRARTADQLDSARFGLSANIRAASSVDSTDITVHVLTPMLEPALELAVDMLRNSDFPPEEVERSKKEWLDGLNLRAKLPTVAAVAAMSELLYPEDHPYRLSIGALAAAARSVRREDLVAFHRAQVQPDSTTVVVAGDFPRAAVVASLEKRLGDWRGRAERKRPPPPTPALRPGPRIVVIDQPGLQQSRILLGCVGVARDATDKAAFDLMDTLLDRRLDENLRRKHAYTYNAATSYAAWRGAGPFEAKTAVAREHTIEALREMLGELERIRTTEASPDELAGVRNQVVNRLAPQFETSLETSNRLALLAVYHEPVARLGRPPTDAELTASDVRSVAAARLPAEAMRLVVVGDAAALREGLAGLGLGAPEVRASPLLSVDAPPAGDED